MCPRPARCRVRPTPRCGRLPSAGLPGLARRSRSAGRYTATSGLRTNRDCSRLRPSPGKDRDRRAAARTLLEVCGRGTLPKPPVAACHPRRDGAARSSGPPMTASGAPGTGPDDRRPNDRGVLPGRRLERGRQRRPRNRRSPRARPRSRERRRGHGGPGGAPRPQEGTSRRKLFLRARVSRLRRRLDPFRDATAVRRLDETWTSRSL